MIRCPTTVFVLLYTSIAASLAQAEPPTSPAADTPRVDRIEIIEKGLYEAPIIKKVEDPTKSSGQRIVYGKREHVKDTADIPATQGTQFGFRYRIIGEPKDAKAMLRIIVVYPGEGRHNPHTGKTMKQDEFPHTPMIGGTDSFVYTLGSWGREPGVWTFQVWDKERKLGQQEFTLAEP
jgi:hypothetical protein